MQFTVSREMHDRFRRAQALLRHAVPSGDAAEIFDRALVLLVDHLERQRLARTSRARASKPTMPGTRHIPAAVQRAVWQRDDGRCAFVGTNGRCRETGFLEFHHVEPYAVGGAATVDNVQLRCRAHNSYEARLFFGESVVREGGPLVLVRQAYRTRLYSRAVTRCPRSLSSTSVPAHVEEATKPLRKEGATEQR